MIRKALLTVTVGSTIFVLGGLFFSNPLAWSIVAGIILAAFVVLILLFKALVIVGKALAGIALRTIMLIIGVVLIIGVLVGSVGYAIGSAHNAITSVLTPTTPIFTDEMIELAYSVCDGNTVYESDDVITCTTSSGVTLTFHR